MTGWDRPYYRPTFELGVPYSLALNKAQEIDHGIVGGFGGSYEDSALLAQAAAHNGDHLELGTLYGATAIMVALTKMTLGYNGKVYCVDNFSYRPEGPEPSADLVMENAKKFGVENYIVLLEGDTYPLPPDIINRHYESAYIDAAHDFDSCVTDWYGVKLLADRVVFHDYDFHPSHMGVVQVVELAIKEPDWRLVHLSHHSAILQKV